MYIAFVNKRGNVYSEPAAQQIQEALNSEDQEAQRLSQQQLYHSHQTLHIITYTHQE